VTILIPIHRTNFFVNCYKVYNCQRLVLVSLDEDDTLILEALTSSGVVHNKIVARTIKFDSRARFT